VLPCSLTDGAADQSDADDGERVEEHEAIV
jgi:hypothetical protein